MSEQNPEAGAVELAFMPYDDRSAGLKVFGILTILLGVVAGLFFVLALIGEMISRYTGGAVAMPLASILPILLTYLILAVALIWLGIGSIHARRWARALLLIFSWSWLVAGVISSISMAFTMPKTLAGTKDLNPTLPVSALVGTFIVMGLVVGVIFIIMPIIWTVFYQSRHVKATCAARDTTPRWTDASPLPVLALCLWLAVWVPTNLVMPISGHALIPFFGTFLTGLPGALISLVMAAICISVIWLLYKIDICGWWLALIAMVLYWVSSVLTYSRYDPIETYQLMGYSTAQLEQLQKSGALGEHTTWISSFLMVPFIAYILFIKRYFPRRSVRRLTA